MAETTEVQSIVALSSAGKRFEIDGVPFVIDGTGNLCNLQTSLAQPLRVNASRSLTAIDSFVAYVNEFVEKRTKLFADAKHDTITAEIDSHAVGSPSHIEHTATLTLEKTVAAKAWIAGNNKPMSQYDFARFIEDNASDIVEPSPATMIEVAKHLSATKTGSFESKVDLENGSFVLSHSEEVRGTIKKGRIDVPQKFYIGLLLYRGGADQLKIEARFRYRIDADGGLTMWYSIPKIDRILEMAFDDIIEGVTKKTKIAVLHGA